MAPHLAIMHAHRFMHNKDDSALYFDFEGKVRWVRGQKLLICSIQTFS